jgi:hypothetical protein
MTDFMEQYKDTDIQITDNIQFSMRIYQQTIVSIDMEIDFCRCTITLKSPAFRFQQIFAT